MVGDGSEGIRCVVYAAKSTEDRRGSIPDQVRECRSVIERDPLRRFVAEYTDEAFSAFRRNRGPGLVDAMQHVEDLAQEHGTAELWAQHSDRLARGDGRSARHAVEIALWALKRDVRVRTVQDPDTFRDLLYAVVTGQRNHEDSRRRGLAIAAGRRRAAARGDFIGYKPDGYKLAVEIDDNGTIKKRMVMDPARQPVIEMIFRLALRGRRTGAIARAANDAGWRTNPVGRGQHPQTWTVQRVSVVLRNPRYAGLAVVNGEVVARGHWPAYITERQHERIRTRMTRRRPTKTPRQLESYLLARIATCGRCGSQLYCMTGRDRADGTFARRYICASHCRGRDAARCTVSPMNADTIEAMFVASIGTLLLDGLEEQAAGIADEPDREDLLSDASTDRQRLRDAVLGDNDSEIDAALERLFVRMSPQAAMLRQAALSQRRARQLESVTRFDAWAEQELAGRTETSRVEARKLNQLLRTWFSTITATMDKTSVEITAQRRSVAGEQQQKEPVRAHFDRLNWERAACLAGQRRLPGQAWDDTAILGALQAWAESHGRSPRWMDWIKGEASHPTSTTVQRHFGAWDRALRRAGLKRHSPTTPPRNYPWDDADIIQALKDWAAKHGRPPSWDDWLLAAPERPCLETVREHFGDWNAGLAAAGLPHA